jgi:hypothetical protein
MQSPRASPASGESHLKMASGTHQQNAEPEPKTRTARINGTASELNRIQIAYVIRGTP